jgi:hypothetical protein
VVKNDYEERIRELNQDGHARDHDTQDDDSDEVMHVHGSVELRHAALEAERAAIREFHLQHELGKELLLRLEREIDMAESRLPKARRPPPAKKRRATKARKPVEPLGAGRG